MRILRGLAWLVAFALLFSSARGVARAFVFSGDLLGGEGGGLGAVSFDVLEVLIHVGALVLAVVLMLGLWHTRSRATRTAP